MSARTVPSHEIRASFPEPSRASRTWRRAALGIALGAGLGVVATGPVEWFVAAAASVAVAAALLGSSRRTEWVVAAYWLSFVVFSTALADAVIGGMFYPFYVAFAAGVLFGLVAGGIRVPPSLAWTYVAFLFVVVTGLIGYQASVGAATVERLVTLAFGALVFVQFRSRAGVALVLRTAIVAAAVTAVWVIVSAVQGDFAYRGSIEANENVVSLYIGLGLVALLGTLLSGSRRDRLIGGAGPTLALLLPMAYALVLLASRGMIVGVVVAVAALAIRTAVTSPRRLGVLGAAGLLVAASLALPGGRGLLERFQDPSTATGGGRTEIWTVVSDAIVQAGPYELALGHGFGASGRLVEQAFATLNSTHNAYLQMTYDFGVVGLALFLGLHVWIVVRSVGVHDDHGWAMLAIVAFLLGGDMFMTTPDNSLYWTALGVLFAAGAWSRTAPASRADRTVAS